MALAFAFTCACAAGAHPGAPASASASASASTSAPANTILVPGASPPIATATTVLLAGSRCTSGACQCRGPGRDDEETPPPPAGSKRFEIRLSAPGGIASFDIENVGTVASGSSGEADTCAYIDIPSGTTHAATLVAKEIHPGEGLAPHLSISEYGPAGPYWYDVVKITCEGPGGRCNRRAAEEWSLAARQRKRGRLDPCGSAVVRQLAWETSGGQAMRDGGLFLDFTARFTMEVKKFATQFAPGASECVPK